MNTYEENETANENANEETAMFQSDLKDVEQSQIRSLNDLLSEIEAEGAEDPNEIIKDRFLCKGSICLLSSQTGCGKSSFVMQLALSFALGKPFAGLEPKRETRTLIIQGENDDRDLADEVSGICRGLSTHELTPYPALVRARDSVMVLTVTDKSGNDFISWLDSVIPEDTDLLVIDPLFAFLGDDVSNQKAISTWIRNGLNTILKKHNVACLLVHHVNKPQKQSLPDLQYNAAYSYSGSGDLANAVRGILSLERIVEVASGDVKFKLTAPKRGTRIQPDFCTWLEWAKDGGIYWQKTSPVTESGLTGKQELREQQKKDLLTEEARMTAGLVADGEAITRKELKERIAGKLRITNHERQNSLISICIADGLLSERPVRDDEDYGRNVKTILELTTQNLG